MSATDASSVVSSRPQYFSSPNGNSASEAADEKWTTVAASLFPAEPQALSQEKKASFQETEKPLPDASLSLDEALKEEEEETSETYASMTLLGNPVAVEEGYFSSDHFNVEKTLKKILILSAEVQLGDQLGQGKAGEASHLTLQEMQSQSRMLQEDSFNLKPLENLAVAVEPVVVQLAEGQESALVGKIELSQVLMDTIPENQNEPLQKIFTPVQDLEKTSESKSLSFKIAPEEVAERLLGGTVEKRLIGQQSLLFEESDIESEVAPMLLEEKSKGGWFSKQDAIIYAPRAVEEPTKSALEGMIAMQQGLFKASTSQLDQGKNQDSLVSISSFQEVLLQTQGGEKGSFISASSPVEGGKSHRSSEPMAQIISQFSTQSRPLTGDQEIKIRLVPEKLGAVDIKLTFDQEGRVEVRLMAEKQETLNLLQGDSSLLKEWLSDEGFEKSTLDFLTWEEKFQEGSSSKEQTLQDTSMKTHQAEVEETSETKQSDSSSLVDVVA